MSTAADKDSKLRSLPEGYPEACADLLQQTAVRLQEEGIDPDRAHEIAFKVAEHMRQHWGGSLIYFAKGAHFEALQWQKEMYAEFNGTNHEQLAKKYNVAVQYIYQIVKLMRAADIAKRQIKLF
jgi:Mor family transcriptional regulator